MKFEIKKQNTEVEEEPVVFEAIIDADYDLMLTASKGDVKDEDILWIEHETGILHLSESLDPDLGFSLDDGKIKIEQ